MENNQIDSELDISQFLNKFNQNTFPSNTCDIPANASDTVALSKTEPIEACIEKLEKNIAIMEHL